MKTLNKSGNINQLQGFVMGIVGLAIVLAVGFIIMAEARTAIGVCPTGYVFNDTANSCHQAGNTSNTTTLANSAGTESLSTLITKVGTIPNWVGILIVVTLASLVLAYFYVRN